MSICLFAVMLLLGLAPVGAKKGTAIMPAAPGSLRELPLPGTWHVRQYAWFQDGSLLVGYSGGNANYQISPWDPGGRQSAITDAGRSVPYDNEGGFQGTLEVSPDGRCVLGDAGASAFSVTGPDGYVRWWQASTKWRRGIWGAGSNWWSEVEPSDKLVSMWLHRVSRAKSAAVRVDIVDGAHLSLPGGEVLGFTGPREVAVFSRGFLQAGSGGFVRTYAIDGKLRQVGNKPVALPEGCVVAGACVSPDIKRICWLVLEPHGFVSKSGGDNIGPENRFLRTTLWISGIDGQKLTKLCAADTGISQLTLETGGGGGYAAWPHMVRWMKNGRAVSYIDGFRVFVAAVPSGDGTN